MDYILVMSVLYVFLFGVCCAFVLCKPQNLMPEKKQGKNLKKSVSGKKQERVPQAPVLEKKGDNLLIIAGGALLVLLILQLVITWNLPGHIQDTGLFRAWAAFGDQHAVWEYYTTDLYVDYPPVYLYVLYLIGLVAKVFGVSYDSNGFIVMVRSIPIIFDGITSLFIYRFSKGFVGEKKALLLAVLSAVNPLNILNSTLWGQIDSVTGLMVAVMLIFLYKKKYVASCTMFAVLILTKPQMIIFSPLMGFVVFFDLIEAFKVPEERVKMLKQVGLSVLAMVAVFLLVPLPITGGNYGLLWKKYTEAVGMYQYATLNAPNFYGMLGGNWRSNEDILLFFSYKTWGFIFIVSISLIVGIVSWRCKDRRKVFYLGVFMVMGIFMLAHSMHERYLHPMFLLMLIIYVLANDRKTLLLYGAFSVTSFINCGYVLYLNHRNDFIYGDNSYFIFLSTLQVVMFIIWIMHAVQLVRQERKPLPKKR